MAKDKSHDFPGEKATVTWQGDLCIHIGECGRAKGDLFVAGRKPWCQPDVAAEKEVREVVLRCPTGALSYRMANGSHEESAAAENTVQVAYNGPLFARGDLQIEGAPENAPGLKFRAALCRCGQSKNKPFCDNSHETAGFQDYGAVGETGDAELTAGGPLQVSVAKNGPILVKGNFTLVSGSGRKAWRGAKAALCRCGMSKNKPFCDGSHKTGGFNSEE